MPAKHKLTFKLPIVPSVKEPLSVKVLLKRLSKLAEELEAIDQDNADLESLSDTTKDLVNKKLLRHNDYGVRSYVALCIAEVLRLFAPDAPYTANQLTDIFKLFLKILSNLADATDSTSYYHQNFSLVKKLADVRSIILITDLPKSEQLLNSLFEIAYNTLGKSKSLSPKLVPIISDILSEVISESGTISQSVLKLILNRFLTNASSNASSSNQNNGRSTVLSSVTIVNPGFKFTVAICESNPERMSRQIAQFVSEVLYENSSSARGGNDDDDDDDSDSDTNTKHKQYNKQLDQIALKNLSKVHKLIEEIWKYVPELLSSVMGLIDSELSADNEKIRIMAAECIGNIIDFQPSKLNFITTHNETWIAWSKKILDQSTAVRTKWIQIATAILNSRFDLVNEISNGVVKALIDTDEKVRLAAVKSIDKNLGSIIFLSKFVNNFTILSTIGQLAREKNKEIRYESIVLLCNLYSAKFSELMEEQEQQQLDNEPGSSLRENPVQLEEGNGNRMEDVPTTTGSLNTLIGWIPDHIISLIYINDKSINYLIDKELVEKIFTLETNSTIRVKRLLFITSTLSEKSKTAFWAINKRQIPMANGVAQYLKLIELYDSSSSENRSAIEQKLEKAISWITATIPTELNSVNALVRFVKLGNKRLAHLIKLCLSTDNSIETIKNSFKEFFGKLNDPKVITNLNVNNPRHTSDDDDQSMWETSLPVTTTEMVETWKVIMYRASVIYYNKSNINDIMQFAKDESNELNKISTQLIEQISSTLPKVFETHIDELVKLVIDSAANDTAAADLTFDADVTSNTGFLAEDSDMENLEISSVQGTPKSKKRQSIINIKNRKNIESLVNTLKTIYHFFVKYVKYLPTENNKFIDSLIKTVTDGTPLESKYAIKLVCLINNAKNQSLKNYENNHYLTKIVKSILPLDTSNYRFPTHLSVISELFLHKPEIVEDEAADITSCLIKEVLLTNQTLADPDSDPVWITDQELEQGLYDNCYAKMLSLRIFVNRLKAFEVLNNDETRNHGEKIDSTELANLVLKLLITCIGNGGELVPNNSSTYPTPVHFQARLRLTAGLMLLKLSKLPAYNRMLKPTTINRLIYLIQDENFEVRKNFIKYLQSYLNDELISQRYLPLIFFMAHEPDMHLRKNVKTWIQSSFNSQISKHAASVATASDPASSLSTDDISFEKAYVRLLHMVAHHQEFIEIINQAYAEKSKKAKGKENVQNENDEASSGEHKENDENDENAEDDSKGQQQTNGESASVDTDGLLFKAYVFAVKYILFYLENILTADNISLLFYFSNRIKQYRDALVSDIDYGLDDDHKPSYVYNLYRIADLSLLSIKLYRSKKNWIIQTFPGKLQLSKDLFSPMKSTREAQQVASKVFILDRLAKKIEQLVKSEIGLSHNLTVRGASDRKRGKNGSANGAVAKKKYKPTTAKRHLKRKSGDDGPVRKSGRVTRKINYADSSSEQEDIDDNNDILSASENDF